VSPTPLGESASPTATRTAGPTQTSAPPLTVGPTTVTPSLTPSTAEHPEGTKAVSAPPVSPTLSALPGSRATPMPPWLPWVLVLLAAAIVVGIVRLSHR
jgi:hypothetical protein